MADQTEQREAIKPAEPGDNISSEKAHQLIDQARGDESAERELADDVAHMNLESSDMAAAIETLCEIEAEEYRAFMELYFPDEPFEMSRERFIDYLRTGAASAEKSKWQLTLPANKILVATSARALAERLEKNVDLLAKLSPSLSPEMQAALVKSESYLLQCKAQQALASTNRMEARAPLQDQKVSESTQNKTVNGLSPSLTPDPSFALQQQLQATMVQGVANPAAALGLMAELQQTNQRFPSQQSALVTQQLQQITFTLAVAGLMPVSNLNSSPAVARIHDQRMQQNPQMQQNPVFATQLLNNLQANPGAAVNNPVLAQATEQQSTAIASPFSN